MKQTTPDFNFSMDENYPEMSNDTMAGGPSVKIYSSLSIKFNWVEKQQGFTIDDSTIYIDQWQLQAGKMLTYLLPTFWDDESCDFNITVGKVRKRLLEVELKRP